MSESSPPVTLTQVQDYQFDIAFGTPGPARTLREKSPFVLPR
jgi:hypothetical protein